MTLRAASFDVPIVLLVFNRPEKTRQVFERIRQIRPRQLFVVADGPRDGNATDRPRCEETRKITEAVDWECEVHRDYAPRNLGLAKRVGSGINWAFESVERAIILEDDCVPDPTFFPYCEEMLKRFADEPHISVIAGSNFQPEGWACGESYYFSRFPHCWGWATWRRAWQSFDQSMARWPERRDGGWLQVLFADKREAAYFRQIFDRVYDGRLSTWDFAWTFNCWDHGWLTVLPSTNLVQNVGFGEDATHTKGSDGGLSRPARKLTWPLVHPKEIVRNATADAYTFKTCYAPPLWKKALRRAVAHVPARARPAVTKLLDRLT